MTLPIENRRYAIRKIWSLNFLLFALIWISFGFINISLNTIIICLIILITSSIVSYYYLKKHNVKSLEYRNDSLIIDYNKRIYEISLTQISNISDALNDYLKLNGSLSKMYIINLKDNFEFGNRILLEYEVKGNIIDDPEFIRELKSKIENRW